jgi:hypothetical protein
MSLEKLQNLSSEIKRTGSDADNEFMKLFNLAWALKNNETLIVKYHVLKNAKTSKISNYSGIKNEFWKYQFELKARNEKFLEHGGNTLEDFEFKEQKYIKQFYEFIEQSYKTLEKEVLKKL